MRSKKVFFGIFILLEFITFSFVFGKIPVEKSMIANVDSSDI